MMDFFLSFKVKLKKELTENLGKTNSDTNVDSVENEPEDELEVCLSDPELGGAPSLKPKVKEDHSQSDICHFDNNVQKENRMNDCEDIPGYDPSLPMEAQENSVLDEIELRGYRDYTPSPNIAKILKDNKSKVENSNDEIRTKFNEMVGGKDTETEKYAEAAELVRGVGSDPYYKLHIQAYEDRRKKDRESIDELQVLFDRRAKLKQLLDDVEKEIKEKITDKL